MLFLNPTKKYCVSRFQGSRFKITYDGLMHYMDIPKCREYDGGKIRVVAKNSEGEEECTTQLTIVPKEDWRARLKQTPRGILIMCFILLV